MGETVGAHSSESGLKSHTDEIQDLQKEKLDKKDFENEIAGLKQLLASGAGDGVELPPSQFTGSEVEKLKEIILSYPNTEKDLRQLIDEIKDINLGMLKEAIN